MNNTPKNNHYDVIIVGSGTCGSTIARELSRRKKKVLILERGGNAPLKESFWGIASIANEVSVSDKLKAGRAITTGGSTGLYFAVAEPPPLDSFRSLGIDLSTELDEVQKELPLAHLPDELLGEQAIKLRESATELGYAWKKKLMLIDQSKCTSGYSFEAKWKARSFVQEAVGEGAILINQATVLKVLVEKKQAIGVEYKLRKKKEGSEICQAYGTKIILAAGSLASPMILRNSGIKDVANRGFYCDPSFAMFGFVPGLKGKDNFPGSMSTDFDDDIALGDGNVSRFFYRLLMLAKLKLLRLSSYSKCIGVGVKLKDGLGGALQEDGRYYKELTKEESRKLKKGEEAAIKILKNAGANHIFHSGFGAGHVGGLIRIQEHLDERLQTEYINLHVCDGSLIPENIRLAPTLTLICLGKYLAKHLS
jgi:hypothetical protein